MLLYESPTLLPHHPITLVIDYSMIPEPPMLHGSTTTPSLHYYTTLRTYSFDYSLHHSTTPVPHLLLYSHTPLLLFPSGMRVALGRINQILVSLWKKSKCSVMMPENHWKPKIKKNNGCHTLPRTPTPTKPAQDFPERCFCVFDCLAFHWCWASHPKTFVF